MKSRRGSRVVPDYTAAVGRRLREVRSKEGWSEGEVATRLDVSSETVRLLESGSKRGVRPVKEIADAIGVNPWWLMFGIEVTEQASVSARAGEFRAVTGNLPPRFGVAA